MNHYKPNIIRELYKNPKSHGHAILKDLGLITVTPVMSHTPQNGGSLHMFKSSETYYIWNIIDGSAHCFKENFDEILKSMQGNEGGIRELQLVDCARPGYEY
jgi:hypothetical protein